MIITFLIIFSLFLYLIIYLCPYFSLIKNFKKEIKPLDFNLEYSLNLEDETFQFCLNPLISINSQNLPTDLNASLLNSSENISTPSEAKMIVGNKTNVDIMITRFLKTVTSDILKKLLDNKEKNNLRMHSSLTEPVPLHYILLIS